MTNQQFFMVYLEGSGAPTFKHETLLSAENEAKRLAKQFRKKAFVLCTLKSVELNEFKVDDCRPNIDDLPF